MAASAHPATGRWIYGPGWDLMVGCGIWYALALVAFSFAGDAIRAGGAMTALPFAVLVFSTPHYGATLLRVYRHRADRRAYTLFAVHATIALAAVFGLGVHNAVVGSWIITIYATWSPWHYSGQNYGLAVMFLRRRGVALDARAKRWLYASFILSYALTFLALHSSADASHYAPVGGDSVNYRFIQLGLPRWISDPALIAVAIAYALALVGSALQLLRRGSARDLLPTATLVGTQALWFSIPLLLRSFADDAAIEPWTSSYGTYYFLWIAIGHAAQYLWITSFYAKGESDWSGPARYFGRAMFAGAAVWTVPALIFAPGVLGRLPYDGGLAVLTAAIVNLHHFVLDGAIWKLRDGRIARMLLRDRGDPARDSGSRSPLESWGGRAVWITGAACMGLMFFAKWEAEIVIPRASGDGDVQRVRSASDRLAWIGRDSVKLRRRLADTLVRQNNIEGAIRELERANEIRPTVSGWFEIGRLHARARRWSASIRALEAALEMNPDEPTVLYELGLARLETKDLVGAEAAFERAVAVEPERGIHQTLLDRTRAAIREEQRL